MRRKVFAAFCGALVSGVVLILTATPVVSSVTMSIQGSAPVMISVTEDLIWSAAPQADSEGLWPTQIPAGIQASAPKIAETWVGPIAQYIIWARPNIPTDGQHAQVTVSGAAPIAFIGSLGPKANAENSETTVMAQFVVGGVASTTNGSDTETRQESECGGCTEHHHGCSQYAQLIII